MQLIMHGKKKKENWRRRSRMEHATSHICPRTASPGGVARIGNGFHDHELGPTEDQNRETRREHDGFFWGLLFWFLF